MSHNTDSAAPRFAVAIMAAGKGTRLKSRHPKVLHRIGGKPLLEHVIQAAAEIVAPADIFAIIGHEAAAVERAVRHTGVNFVLQERPNGTGHAIQMARAALSGYDGFIVLSGDAPLIRAETIRLLRDTHMKNRSSMTVLTAELGDAADYGRILRRHQDGQPTALIDAIVESKDAMPAQLAIREINSGIYAFAAADVFAHLDELRNDNANGEFYLTDMAAILNRAGARVEALCAADAAEVLGVNTRAELALLDALLRRRKTDALMAAGVTIFRPETCSIDAAVEIGTDTVIEPFTQLLGSTRVGSDCHIHSYCVINDSVLADGVLVRPGCILNECKVASGAILGPYSHIRPASDIGPGAHVGNFVELKKTRLGKGSKANHLSYLGDAIIGEGANIGAGTITCNYDGVNKNVTTIGDGAFIGSDSTLVAPVTVGRLAYVGASSCITADVPDEALAIGRARQSNKPGWATRLRQRYQRTAEEKRK